MENGSTEHSKGNKTVQRKVATTRRGWTQIEYQNKHYNINLKRRRNIGRPKKRWRDQLHIED